MVSRQLLLLLQLNILKFVSFVDFDADLIDDLIETRGRRLGGHHLALRHRVDRHQMKFQRRYS